MADEKTATIGVHVHRCRFVDYQPQGISAIAFANHSPYLAVARNDGSIEIWNIQFKWFQQFVIPGKGRDYSARSLVWVPAGPEFQSKTLPERLFSTGLSGEIIEWDLKTLSPKVIF